MMQNISEALQAGQASSISSAFKQRVEQQSLWLLHDRSGELLKRLPAAKKNGYYGNIQHDIPGILPAYMRITSQAGYVLRSYIRTYLERDIRDSTQVADEGLFISFSV